MPLIACVLSKDRVGRAPASEEALVLTALRNAPVEVQVPIVYVLNGIDYLIRWCDTPEANLPEVTPPAQAAPVTAQALVNSGANLSRVREQVKRGVLSEASANEFFKLWAYNKMYYRWNETLNRPEEGVFGIRKEQDHWREFTWA